MSDDEMLPDRRSERLRAFIFRVSNYSDEEQELIQNFKFDYVLYGREISPSTGTPHLQGYIYHANKTCFNTLKKLMPRAFIDEAHGTPEQNIKYCTKERDFFEKGKRPSQGARNDLSEVRKMVNKGAGMRQVVEESNSFQAIKFAEVYLKYKEPKRTWMPEVYWYYGPTGTGKTRLAHELAGEDVFVMSIEKWWDGYDAHSAVIIDDIRPDSFKFSYLLRLLDRYECRVEHKGSSRQFLAKKIWITSPYNPSAFGEGEKVDQLIRRITEIKEFRGALDL